MLQVLDSVCRWAFAQLQRLPLNARTVVVAVLVVVVTYGLLAILSRRLLPWLATRVILPGVGALVSGLSIALLGVQALLAAPFRLAEVSPPNTLYVLGDAIAATSRGTRHATGQVAAWIRRSRPIKGWILVALMFAASVWWNAHSCLMLAKQDCQPPLSAVADAIGSLASDSWHWLRSSKSAA